MRRASRSHRQVRQRVIAVAILVLALVLRLPWTVPDTADPSRGLAAAFGEHALCLAAGSGAAAPAGGTGDAPAGPSGHAGHDAAKCCQSHAAGEILLPGGGLPTLVVFATPADRFLEPGPFAFARSIGRAWARAPPSAAG